MVNTANRWSAADYAKNASFVPRLGDAVLQLLDPQPGELLREGDRHLAHRVALPDHPRPEGGGDLARRGDPGGHAGIIAFGAGSR